MAKPFDPPIYHDTNIYTYGLFLRGKIFCEFHELKTIRENFTLEMLPFNRYSLQSVMICENFPLEKLGKAQFVKIFPLENNPLLQLICIPFSTKL